jgi:hypothetical protein
MYEIKIKVMFTVANILTISNSAKTLQNKVKEFKLFVLFMHSFYTSVIWRVTRCFQKLYI